jgi:chromosome segregation ATPase
MTVSGTEAEEDPGKEVQRLEGIIKQLSTEESALLKQREQETSALRTELAKLRNEVTEKQRGVSRLERQIRDIETAMDQAIRVLKHRKKDAQGQLEQLRKLQIELEQKARIASSLAILRGDRAKAAQIVELLSVNDRIEIRRYIKTLHQSKLDLAEDIRQEQALASNLNQRPTSQHTDQQLREFLSSRKKVEDARKDAAQAVDLLYNFTRDKLLIALEQRDPQLRALGDEVKKTRQQIRQLTEGGQPELDQRQEDHIRRLENGVAELEKRIQQYQPIADLIGDMSQWSNNAPDV